MYPDGESFTHTVKETDVPPTTTKTKPRPPAEVKAKKVVPRQATYISLADAAKILDFHPKSVRKLIAQGRLKAWKVAGSAVRVKHADVMALFEPVPTRD